MGRTSDDLVSLGEIQALEREYLHPTLLDLAERAWDDVEAGRVKPISALRGKYAHRR